MKKAPKIDMKKLGKVLIFAVAVFACIFLIIFAVLKDFSLLFSIADIIYIILIIDFIAFWVYTLLFGGRRWIRSLVQGLSGLMFIILSLSLASAEFTTYLLNPATASSQIGINILVSLIGMGLGGVLYYMAFNGHPIAWLSDVAAKIEEEEHRDKLISRLFKKIKNMV